LPAPGSYARNPPSVGCSSVLMAREPRSTALPRESQNAFTFTVAPSVLPTALQQLLPVVTDASVPSVHRAPPAAAVLPPAKPLF